MPTTVRLTMIEGMTPGKEFDLGDQATCMIGRGEGCSVQLPDDPAYMEISRCHCLLAIDLPLIHVRDLGSRNGTYVNGVLIGRRGYWRLAAEQWRPAPADYCLKDGDEVRLGGVVLRLEVSESTARVEGGIEAPAEETARV